MRMRTTLCEHPQARSVVTLEILKHASEFYETWHESYATGDQPNAVTSYCYDKYKQYVVLANL